MTDDRPKQIITTVKNDSVTNRPVITATTTTTTSSKPVSLTPIATSANSNGNLNQMPVRTTTIATSSSNNAVASSNYDKPRVDLNTRGLIPQTTTSNQQVVNAGVRLATPGQLLNK